MLSEYIERETKRRAEDYGRAMKVKLHTFLEEYFPQTYEDPLSQMADIVANEVWAKAGPALVANKKLKIEYNIAKNLAEIADEI